MADLTLDVVGRSELPPALLVEGRRDLKSDDPLRLLLIALSIRT